MWERKCRKAGKIKSENEGCCMRQPHPIGVLTTKVGKLSMKVGTIKSESGGCCLRQPHPIGVLTSKALDESRYYFVLSMRGMSPRGGCCPLATPMSRARQGVRARRTPIQQESSYVGKKKRPFIVYRGECYHPTRMGVAGG
jgi:hypothetical protein